MKNPLENNNLSILDGDNSYLYEEDKYKNIQTPTDKMRELARCLGENNLTVDLSCLLDQKRKN